MYLLRRRPRPTGGGFRRRALRLYETFTPSRDQDLLPRVRQRARSRLFTRTSPSRQFRAAGRRTRRISGSHTPARHRHRSRPCRTHQGCRHPDVVSRSSSTAWHAPSSASSAKCMKRGKRSGAQASLPAASRLASEPGAPRERCAALSHFSMHPDTEVFILVGGRSR
jgi:hypothetical protein